MRTTEHSGASNWQRPSRRQRLGAIGLTLLAEALVVVVVILFGAPRVRDLIVPASPTAITFVPNAVERSEAPRRQRAEEKAAAARPQPPVPPRAPPPVPTPRAALPYIPLSRSDMAASDISKLGSAAAPAVAGEGTGTKTAAGPGDGPGGVTLYNAEWVVEPSNAELRTYLPRAIDRGSWAMIACQTIAHNRVENCAQLGESPRGSGLSKAMRLAAWQFKIRPPRIDGKPMVGAWVRIRIDFNEPGGE